MSFEFLPQEPEGLVLVRPLARSDERGYFLEEYRVSAFAAAGIDATFVQDNHSVSARGVLRGIHYQLAPHAQGKLIGVTRGAIWDVSVDMRRASPTFGHWYGVQLDAENPTMLYMPPGFGHGFVALSDDTHVHYKCTREYESASERGVRWDDPDLAIRWPLSEVTVSEKDAALPGLADAEVYEVARP